MDDKLYYVESPEGQVLGPMTMMNILEGIAAGAVLEDARVCEVGQAGWTSLADMAYARADAPPARSPEPARVRPGSSVRKLSDDFLVEERWTPPAQKPVPRTEEERAARARERLVTPRRTNAPAPPPEAPASTPEAAGVSAANEVEEWADATRDFAADRDRPAPPVERFDGRSHDEPSYDEAERPKSGDFSLSLPEADDEADSYAERRSRSTRRGRVPVTLIAAFGGVAVLAGAWFAFGSKITGLGQANDATAPDASPSPAAPGTDAIDEAWRALNGGDAVTALASFRRVVEEQPESARAQHGLGLAALQTGDLELASAHLERATSLAPDDTRMRLDLGTVRLREGRWELAIQEAQKAQAMAPENPAPLWLIGRAHAAGGRQDEAVKVLASYVERAPRHDEARRDLAQALAAAGRVAPAIDEMNAYLQARPDDRDGQKARLDWMISVGQQAAAGRIYGEAAAKQPNDSFAHYLAGIACTGTEDGVTHLRRAVELAPSHRDSWVSLARAQAAIGRTALAVEAMTKATALAPATAAEAARLAEWKAATPPAVAPPPPPVDAGPIPTLADRVGEMRRALGRGDFRATRRALEAARTELAGREAQRNLSLWAAIIDFEEGHLEEAENGFAALDPNASYLGFGAGAVTNLLARSHLARGDVRGAIGVLDQVAPDHADEYAAARLWEGIALSSLGMEDLAKRTWARLSEDAGSNVGKNGRAAVKSAEFLAGVIAEKDYRTAVAPIEDYENDMHFILGWAARANSDAARAHFRECVESSHGREFPYQLARKELDGAGLGRK
jgi:tetratricopeptide (TPR) repeat protein